MHTSLAGVITWLLGATCVLLAPTRVVAAQERTQGPLVTALELRGVTQVNRDELAAGLATKASECRSILYAPICWFSDAPYFVERRRFNPEEFRRDALRIRLFYWLRGYRDAAVASRTERDGDGVRVIFDITEGPPTTIQSLEVVHADSVLPRQAVQSAVQVKAGDPVSLVALDSSVTLLGQALWDRGYADAEITLDTARVSNEANTGPVTITITPGQRSTVRTIEIEGNRSVSERTIRRLLTFRSGDVFRRSALLDSQRELYLSGLFSAVTFEAEPPDDSQKVVRIRVTEGDLHQLDLSGGVTSADFLQLQAEYTRFDFLGSARRVTLRATTSNLFARALNGNGFFQDVAGGGENLTGTPQRQAFLQPNWATSLEFTQPWLFSVHNQLGASIFAHRRSVPGIVIDRGTGATIALTRKFGIQTNSTLGYTYESSEIDASDVYFCVTFGVCVPTTINVISSRHPLSPIAWVTQTDRTNDPFAPDRGLRARLDLEHAAGWTQSDFQYSRAMLEGSTYFRVRRGSVLAGRVRVGWVRPESGTQQSLGLPPDDAPIIHPRKRFYAGGSRSVRGFAENQLGPRVLTVSPGALTDTARATACTAASLAHRSCDPNTSGVPVSSFNPQAIGGTSLVEGTIEYRFPILRAMGLTGAVFVDGAIVGANQVLDLAKATGAVTPGFGVRLDTPVGPVRVDLGVRPRLVERLPVITQATDSLGATRLVTLNTPLRYDPVEDTGAWYKRWMNRLMLHLAIGPAF